MTDGQAGTAPSGIIQGSFERPSDTIETAHGRAELVTLGSERVWRSRFEPGWSWDTDYSPLADGARSCPQTHREYVEAGRIRYEMDDGSVVEATAGDVLFIPPGHRASVVGEEACVLVDW